MFTQRINVSGQDSCRVSGINTPQCQSQRYREASLRRIYSFPPRALVKCPRKRKKKRLGKRETKKLCKEETTEEEKV